MERASVKNRQVLFLCKEAYIIEKHPTQDEDHHIALVRYLSGIDGYVTEQVI